MISERHIPPRAGLLSAMLFVAVAVCVGYLVATNPLVAFACIAFGLLLVVGKRWPGLGALAVLIIATNSVPFVNLRGGFGGVSGVDVGAVLAVLYWLMWPKERFWGLRANNIARGLLVFTGFWVLQVLRSVIVDGIPPTQALLYGRAFAFALPAFLMVVSLSHREVRRLSVGIMVWGSLFSIAYIGQAMGRLNGEFLVHSLSVRPGVLGVVRIYSLGVELAILALFLSVGVVARWHRSAGRSAAWLIVMLTGVQVVLQLSRGLMIVLPAAMLIVLILDSLRRPQTRSLWTGLPGWLVVSAIAILAWGSVLSQAYEIVQIRLISAAQDVGTLGGNFGYRVDIVDSMVAALGGYWPVGLGFLHPEVKPVSSLPSGSLINADLGMFSMLMTMGLLCVVLWWAIEVAGIRLALRDEMIGTNGFIAIGCAAWLVYGLLASPTILPSPLVTGAVLGSLVALSGGIEESLSPDTVGEGI